MCVAMTQQDPQLYAQLTGQLQPEEQQVIKAAIEQADKIEAEALAARAAAGGTASGAPQTNGS